MTTTPTQLPVPSEKPQDLKFNAGKIDQFVTSDEQFYIDRLNGKHRTIAGINYDANQAILNYGYITKDSFEDGSTLSLANECLRWESNGEYYRWDGQFPKVVPAGSTPGSAGGVGPGKWVSVGDASLRSDLASPDGVNIVGGSGLYVYISNGTDDSAGLAAANAAAIAAKSSLKIVGVAKVVAPTTITARIDDSLNQIFTIDSNVSIASYQTKVRPEMFGDIEGAFDKCVQVLPVTGGDIYLESRRYKSSHYAYGFGGAGKFIGKDNISIIGKKQPDANYSCSTLENGSIIEGCVLVWANNFSISNVGIDSGKDFVDGYFNGIPAVGVTEGLMLSFPNDATKNTGTRRVNARLHNITGLAPSPLAPNHAIIAAEGYSNTRCTGLMHAIMGIHGFVIKAINTTVEDVLSECQGGNAVIIKSDSGYTGLDTTYDLEINNIRSIRGGINRAPHTTVPTAGSNGLLLNTTGTNAIDNVRIKDFSSDGHAFGVQVQKTDESASIINIKFDAVHVDGNSSSGTRVGVYSPNPAGIVQIHFNELAVRNMEQAIGTGTASNIITVGKLDCKIITDALVDIQGTTIVDIDSITHGQCTASGAWRLNTNAILKIGSVVGTAGELPEFATGSLTATLNAGHTAVQPVTARLRGKGVELNGLVKSPSATACISLPVGLSPKINQRLGSVGKDTSGAENKFCPLVVGSDGSVILGEGGTPPTEWGSIASFYPL